MSKTIIIKAETRGHANHGWLDSNHTFSFANYYNPARNNFGLLRVLNDDIVDGGMGFGTHPHDNMEIISIPIFGDLEHKDSMGTMQVIHQNDVQIMSAGTGVYHSEYNHSKDSKVNFLQIWIFPKERNIQPRYDQKTYLPEDRINKFQTVVAPNNPEALVINQDAWLSLGKLEAGTELTYKINKSGNGVFAFILNGNTEIDGESLMPRDGMGIWETEEFKVKANALSEVLLIEVPMDM